jgi:membrane protease YdiL (CAAX protease family)
MSAINAYIKRYPVLTYYVLTFAISWGGVLLVIGGPGVLTRTNAQFMAVFPLAILGLLAGPSIMGILSTGIFSGKAGLRDYISRLFKWRVGARWYAVALLTAPFLFLAILLLLSQSSPAFLPGLFTAGDKASHLIMGLATGLAAGFFEELGWTGFAIPRLRQRYSVLATGLIVGFLWAVWHLLPVLWVGFASGSMTGALPLVSFLLDPFLFLMAFRVLIVWVYDRTGSLLVGMLMHFSLTASARIFMPTETVGATLLTFDLIWAAALWLVVAVVVVTNARQLSRQPLTR